MDCVKIMPVTDLEYFKTRNTEQRINFIKQFSKILTFKEIKQVHNLFAERKKYLSRCLTIGLEFNEKK